jgi:hypothetical protein
MDVDAPSAAAAVARDVPRLLSSVWCATLPQLLGSLRHRRYTAALGSTRGTSRGCSAPCGARPSLSSLGPSDTVATPLH